MSRTATTLKFKMFLFLDEAHSWAEKLFTNINLPPLMPDEDNNFGGSLVLDFRKWWRHVHWLKHQYLIFARIPWDKLNILFQLILS